MKNTLGKTYQNYISNTDCNIKRTMTNGMMSFTTLSSSSYLKRRHRAHVHLASKLPRSFELILVLLTWCLFNCLQQQQQQRPPFTSHSLLISALYLGPQQQQQQHQQIPELASNGAIIQALSQFAAQQAASGVPSGSLQVATSTGPNGAITIAPSSGNSNNNNNNLGLVNINNNQTTIPSGTASTTTQQQGANSNQFVIKWIHDDPKNHMAYVSITPVNYTNLHEPRIELRYQSKYPFVSLNESALNSTVVAAIMVQDEDSGPNGETSLSIEQGNELGHFKLVSTSLTNTIQVNGAPLSRHRVPEYNLTIVARDHGSPPKSSSSNLVIKLQASPNPTYYPSHLPPPAKNGYPYGPLDPNLSDASTAAGRPPVTDLMYVGTMLVLMFAAVVILIIFGCALVQRPAKHHLQANKGHSSLSSSHKGLVLPNRTTSATNSRIMPPLAPNNQCSTYCLSNGYNRTNL